MADDISWDRRRFLGTAAMMMAAAQCGIIDAAQAQSRTTPPADAHRVITGGIGHNLPQEAPQAFADAVLEVDRY
jgi:nitrous oxide reductase